MNEARLKECLEIWRDWMCEGGINLGYPKQSLVLSSGGVNCFDDVGYECDVAVALVVDAAMTDFFNDNLSYLATVIEMSLGLLPKVFKHNRMSYGEALDMAHGRIYRKLQSAGMA